MLSVSGLTVQTRVAAIDDLPEIACDRDVMSIVFSACAAGGAQRRLAVGAVWFESMGQAGWVSA